jgi:hypothetical protein
MAGLLACCAAAKERRRSSEAGRDTQDTGSAFSQPKSSFLPLLVLRKHWLDTWMWEARKEFRRVRAQGLGE